MSADSPTKTPAPAYPTPWQRKTLWGALTSLGVFLLWRARRAARRAGRDGPAAG